VEAARHSIPVVALGESAVSSLYSQGLDSVEDLQPVDPDHLTAWLAHLSYSQFSRAELQSGLAWEIVGDQL